MKKHTENNLKKKPNKLWWAHPHNAKWKTFQQSLKIPQKMLRVQEKSLNEQITLPEIFPINDQNKNINLSPDMEIIKITTIVEAIRQKRKRNAQISETIQDIQEIIGKKRLKRSSHESRYKSMTTDSWHDQEKKTFTLNRRARYPKSHHRDQQKKSLPTRKRAVDLKVASNIAIPSTEFYKRIWEYINGTRPHSDIISDYSSLTNNSEKNNSTCTDKDQITVSQSQKHDKLQVISPNIKPEQDFYKHIWDIINATQSTYESTKPRSKRNANISKSNTSPQLCLQERKTNYYSEDKQPQRINDEVTLNITKTINPREISDPYVSDFWNFNKTQQQPKTAIPIVNMIKLNNNPISSSINSSSASEVADLNKSDNIEINIDHLSSDNSKEFEKRNRSQKIIIKPRPSHSSQEQENSTISSSSPIEQTIDNAKKKDQTKYTKDYSTNTTPIYDPSNIPYVEVPDYTDQQEDSLDKGQNLTAEKYKEYDDSDSVNFERHYNPDEFSSKSPSGEIKVLHNIQTENNEPEISLNADISHSRCTENKDSIECTDKYDVKDTKLRNNNASDNAQHSIEDSIESNKHENSTDFVDFDINEYRKPFNLDDFIEDDSIFENIQTNHSKENTKYNDKENPTDRNEEAEEFEIYATVPKEESHNYFKKNEDYDDGIIFDDRDEEKKNTHSSVGEKAEDSDVISEDHYHYDDKDFLSRIFGENNDKDSSESSESSSDAEDKFLSHYFTKDVLDQLRGNSTAEEERQREESRNREEIHKTLSKILDKKDRFSRLDENLDKMIEEGETIPIKYNNFWSLEYESPRKKNEATEETES